MEDQGPGIPEHARQMIFEPFRQVEGSDSRRKGGSGLGLSIVRGFVAAQGGEVTTANRPEGGACFTIYLPLTSPARVPDDEP